MRRFDVLLQRFPFKQFLKFGTVGGLGVAVNSGVLYLCTEWIRLDYRVGSIIAIELAILHNFLWNYLWTFGNRGRRSLRHAGRSLVKFNISSSMTALAVNWVTLVFLTEVAGLNYLLSNLVGITLGTTSNFLLSRHWAFLPSKSKRPLP